MLLKYEFIDEIPKTVILGNENWYKNKKKDKKVIISTAFLCTIIMLR